MKLMKLVWLAAVVNSLFLLNVGFAGASGYSPDEHTVLLMHFDEGKGNPKDSSSKGNHGINNGATWTTGKFGKALSFDGIDDYVDCGSKTSLDITNALTIEVWVHNIGSTNHEHIVSKRTRYNDTQYGLLKTNDNRIMFEYGRPEGGWRAVTGDDFPLNRWAHVAVTVSGTAYNFYVDGESAGSGNLLNVIESVNAPVYIGSYGSAGAPRGEWWNGKIDEVRISNKVRSLDEMITHDDSFVSLNVGNFNPEKVVMIGDEPGMDLKSSRKAGIRYSIIIDRKQKDKILSKDGGIFVNSLRMVPQILK